MIGSKCPILLSPHCSSQDFQGLVRSFLVWTGEAREIWKLTERDTLPPDWQTALLRLLLQTLSFSLSPSNSRTHQGGNGIVVRKLFGSVCPSFVPDPLPIAAVLLAYPPEDPDRQTKIEADDSASITSPPYTSSPIPKPPYYRNQFDPIIHSRIRSSPRISPRIGVQYPPRWPRARVLVNSGRKRIEP